jgi:hypothetical protein
MVVFAVGYVRGDVAIGYGGRVIATRAQFCIGHKTSKIDKRRSWHVEKKKYRGGRGGKNVASAAIRNVQLKYYVNKNNHVRCMVKA